MEVKGKIAIVTGASSGLGKEVTELLAQEGVTVFALARSVDEINFSSSVIKIPCNITNVQSIDSAFDQIDTKTNSIDFLINCAGRALVKNLEETSREEIMDVLRINLMGNIYIAQEVYKRMLPQKSGHIINISSTSGLKTRPDETIYAASKWGLRGFTESLRLAASVHNIRVTGIYPGGMQTNFWKNVEGRDISKFMNPKDIAQQIISILTSPTSISPSEYVIERGF